MKLISSIMILKMKYLENILETIGNTPLIKLNKITENLDATILAKVEYFNPCGSVKDRIGIKMLLDAEKKGIVKKGITTIVEPTSGNTGLGLALVASLKGYKTIFVMPDKMSEEKELLLRAYGAEVIRTPTDVAPNNPESYYKVAERLVNEIKDAFSPNQYFNESNPQAHYDTTGPEIWNDTDGKVTHFIAGLGTGGTISGVGKYLKEKNQEIKVVGVDPVGSIYSHEFYKTEPILSSYKIEGIGEDFIPKTINFDTIDEIVQVNDKDGFLMTRKLVKEEGLLVGGSSGSAVYAALETAKDLDKNALVVVLLPDSGRNYLSKIFNDKWMKENGFI